MRFYFFLIFFVYSIIGFGQTFRLEDNLAKSIAELGWTIQYSEVDSMYISEYSILNESKMPSEFEKYDKLIRKGKTKKIKKQLIEVAAQNRNDYMVRRLLGHYFYQIGDETEGRLWYEASIDAKPDVWDSYFILAKIFREQGDHQRALRYSMIAWIFNRNSIELQTFNMELLELVGNPKSVWKFSSKAQAALQQNILTLQGDENWYSYETCRALWKVNYPKNTELKEIEPTQFLLAEDKECLLNLLVSMNQANESPQGEDAYMLETLQYSLEQKYIDQFILFEIWLPQIPSLASRLTNKDIKTMMEYILFIRG